MPPAPRLRTRTGTSAAPAAAPVSALAPASAVRAMLAARPEAWSLGVPGAGHDVHLERPDAVAGFLDAFLAAHV
ncbi:alpha/beta fold hydrolase [Streptomyces sp. NRRL F-5630]|uniref:alpha/beta fold hydrolase n=1 Tax=Streptomyces sp. NRRL F-5630 TaxID=1463864 RepID=UPI003D729212